MRPHARVAGSIKSGRRLHDLDGAVVVAVITVGVVQSAVDEVVGVVSVRHRVVSAARPVGVVGVVAVGGLRVAVGMRVVDGEGVLVDVIFVGVVRCPSWR
jgi:hypothetical protein